MYQFTGGLSLGAMLLMVLALLGCDSGNAADSVDEKPTAQVPDSLQDAYTAELSDQQVQEDLAFIARGLKTRLAIMGDYNRLASEQAVSEGALSKRLCLDSLQTNQIMGVSVAIVRHVFNSAGQEIQDCYDDESETWIQGYYFHLSQEYLNARFEERRVMDDSLSHSEFQTKGEYLAIDTNAQGVSLKIHMHSTSSGYTLVQANANMRIDFSREGNAISDYSLMVDGKDSVVLDYDIQQTLSFLQGRYICNSQLNANLGDWTCTILHNGIKVGDVVSKNYARKLYNAQGNEL